MENTDSHNKLIKTHGWKKENEINARKVRGDVARQNRAPHGHEWATGPETLKSIKKRNDFFLSSQLFLKKKKEWTIATPWI